MLVFLGVNVLRKSFGAERVHLHTHSHNPETHTHFHVHENPQQDHAPSPSVQRDAPALYRRHGAWLGRQRGVDVARASTIESPWALAYIVIFGLGSVGGMLLLSGIISLPFILTAQRFTAMNRWIRVVAGFASVAFGTLSRLGNRLGANWF